MKVKIRKRFVGKTHCHFDRSPCSCLPTGRRRDEAEKSIQRRISRLVPACRDSLEMTSSSFFYGVIRKLLFVTGFGFALRSTTQSRAFRSRHFFLTFNYERDTPGGRITQSMFQSYRKRLREAAWPVKSEVPAIKTGVKTVYGLAFLTKV